MPLINVGDDWQTAINANAAGAAFTIAVGTHRHQSVVPKNNQSFTAVGPGAIMSGAKILATGSWVADTGRWYITGQTQQGTVETQSGLACNTGFPCANPEDVFYDGVPLAGVTSLGAGGVGKFFFDYAADRIYIWSTPTGHVIETSVTSQAFNHASLTVSGVTISGLTIEKYASPTTVPAVAIGPGWTVTDCEVRHNHYSGIGTFGDGTTTVTVRNCYVHDNGCFGFDGSGGPILIEDCQISYNNYANYNSYNGAGGSKWVYTNGLTVRRCWSHHNNGPGLWTDINNINTIYEYNTCEDNLRPGIFHELSYAAIIRYNICRRNGTIHDFYFYTTSAGIEVVDCPNVEVYGNTCIDNFQGITGLQDSRIGPGLYGEFLLQNFYVHDNVVRTTIDLGDGTGISGVHSLTGSETYTSRNNVFARNVYQLGPQTNYFFWNGAIIAEAAWAAAQDAYAVFHRGAMIDINLGDDWQTVVNTGTTNSAFFIKAGTHRLQNVTPVNGQKFVGETGAIMSGARVLSSPVASGSTWYYASQTQEGTTAGTAAAAFPRATRPEDVFVDGVRQLHVTTLGAVVAGTWFFDYAADRIYVGTNPTGHTIEATVTAGAFLATGSTVTGVVVSNLLIEKYASPAQTAMVYAPSGSGWQVSSCELRYGHSIGVQLGASGIVTGNYVHHNGQAGVATYNTTSQVIVDNDVSYNGQLFDPLWAAGGLRLVYLGGTSVVSYNDVHHNYGPGIWCDVDSTGLLVEHNTATDNAANGILVEVSFNTVVRFNTVERNGFGTTDQASLAGICVQSSTSIELNGNTLANNARGIIVWEEARGTSLAYGIPWETINFYAHDNIVRQDGVPAGLADGVNGLYSFKGDAPYTSKNNHWENDHYFLGAGAAYFYWLSALRDETQWQAYSNDETGTFVRASSAGVARVQQNFDANHGGTVGSITVPYLSNVTSTNLSIVIVRNWNGGAAVLNVQDTRGTSYVNVCGVPVGSPDVSLYLYAGSIPTTGANTVTVNFASSATVYAWVQVIEVSFNGATASLSTAHRRDAVPAALVQSSLPFTTAGPAYVIMAASMGDVTTYSVGSDTAAHAWTLLNGTLGSGGSTYGGSQEYVTTGVLDNVTVSINSSAATQPYAVVLAAFRGVTTTSLTGTGATGLTEADIRAGGKTIVITLNNDTFIA